MQVNDFGMFTPAGDAAVAAIIDNAIENYRGYVWVLRQLSKLAEVDIFAEAMDTAVREACYDAMKQVDSIF